MAETVNGGLAVNTGNIPKGWLTRGWPMALVILCMWLFYF